MKKMRQSSWWAKWRAQHCFDLQWRTSWSMDCLLAQRKTWLTSWSRSFQVKAWFRYWSLMFLEPWCSDLCLCLLRLCFSEHAHQGLWWLKYPIVPLHLSLYYFTLVFLAHTVLKTTLLVLGLPSWRANKAVCSKWLSLWNGTYCWGVQEERLRHPSKLVLLRPHYKKFSVITKYLIPWTNPWLPCFRCSYGLGSNVRWAGILCWRSCCSIQLVCSPPACVPWIHLASSLLSLCRPKATFIALNFCALPGATWTSWHSVPLLSVLKHVSYKALPDCGHEPEPDLPKSLNKVGLEAPCTIMFIRVCTPSKNHAHQYVHTWVYSCPRSAHT